MRILVTGASGFVGQHLCKDLFLAGHQVRGLTRGSLTMPQPPFERVFGDITNQAAVAAAVSGVDAIVHLAARAHIMKETSIDPLSEYRRVNVEGTRFLLDAARDAGVSFLILASSVKAVCEASDTRLSTVTVARPVDPYGVSKRQAEILVHAASFPTTILRFPLIYGPGVRGNVFRLFELISNGWPIPVGTTPNARSVLYVGNATAAIRRVLEINEERGRLTPAGPFFIADGPPLSTSELVHDIASALQVRGRTIPIPIGMACRAIDAVSRTGAKVSSKAHAVANRLGGSLAVDEHEFFRAFQFQPPFTRMQGLSETACWFKST